MALQTTIIPALTAAESTALLSKLPSALSFTPRPHFEVSQSITRSYFLGHHHAGLARMRRSLTNIGLIIECRDFRVPLTSWNSLLESSLSIGSGGRQRIIVYTKRDLGPTNQEGGGKIIDRLMAFHRKQGDYIATNAQGIPTSLAAAAALAAGEPLPSAPAVIFMGQGLDAKGLQGEKKLLEAVQLAAQNHESMTGLRAMVVGMPNAGKSTLLNKLRARGMGRAKAARTGSEPGVTRRLSTPVRVLPPSTISSSSGSDETNGKASQQDPLQQGVFIMDTPGVFVPYVPDAESMLKLALVGCVKDGLIDIVTLADYLLYHLNKRNLSALYYPRFCPRPTNNVDEFLQGIAYRTGKLLKGGLPDMERTAAWIVMEWRQGRLGRFVLDEVDDGALKEAKRLSLNPPLSLTQARKREKELRVARSLAKRGLS